MVVGFGLSVVGFGLLVVGYRLVCDFAFNKTTRQQNNKTTKYKYLKLPTKIHLYFHNKN